MKIDQMNQNFINATQAKEASLKNLYEKINFEEVNKFLETMCYPEIMRAIESGNTTAVILLDCYDIYTLTGSVKSLEGMGYVVSFESGERNKYSTLKISWK